MIRYTLLAIVLILSFGVAYLGENWTEIYGDRPFLGEEECPPRVLCVENGALGDGIYCPSPGYLQRINGDITCLTPLSTTTISAEPIYTKASVGDCFEVYDDGILSPLKIRILPCEQLSTSTNK